MNFAASSEVAAQNLTAAIQKRGIKGASELAQITGLNRITLGAYMRGERNPGFEACVILADALGVHPQSLRCSKRRKNGAKAVDHSFTASELVIIHKALTFFHGHAVEDFLFEKEHGDKFEALIAKALVDEADSVINKVTIIASQNMRAK